MEDLLNIISSRARLLTILVLYRQSIPVPLRHIAHIAGIPVYSVQNALKSLLATGMVKRKREGRYTLLSLNRDDPYYEVVASIASAISAYGLKRQAGRYSQRAISALEFASSAGEMLSGLRRQ